MTPAMIRYLPDTYGRDGGVALQLATAEAECALG